MKRSFQVEVILFPHTNNSSSPLETTGRNQYTYFYFSFAYYHSPSSWLQGTHPLGQTQTVGHLCLPPSLTPSFPPSSAPRIQFRTTTFNKSISAPRAPLLQDGAHRHSVTMRSGERGPVLNPQGCGNGRSGMGTRTGWDGISWLEPGKFPRLGVGKLQAHVPPEKSSLRVSASRLTQNTGHHSQ